MGQIVLSTTEIYLQIDQTNGKNYRGGKKRSVIYKMKKYVNEIFKLYVLILIRIHLLLNESSTALFSACQCIASIVYN